MVKILKKVTACLALLGALEMSANTATPSTRFGFGLGGSLKLLTSSKLEAYGTEGTILVPIGIYTRQIRFNEQIFGIKNKVVATPVFDFVYQYMFSKGIRVGVRGAIAPMSIRPRFKKMQVEDTKLSNAQLNTHLEDLKRRNIVNEGEGWLYIHPGVPADGVEAYDSVYSSGKERIREVYQLLVTLSKDMSSSIELGFEAGLVVQAFKTHLGNKKQAIGGIFGVNVAYFFNPNFSTNLMVEYQAATKKIIGMKNKIKGFNLSLIGRYNI